MSYKELRRLIEERQKAVRKDRSPERRQILERQRKAISQREAVQKALAARPKRAT